MSSEELRALDAARIAVAALLLEGVRYVVVAPGSRSAPMAYALAEADAMGRVELLVRIDERDAGFTALGLALATGAPAAVLTTSGTAVGNLLPAVMEANHAAVPLVVISADRPVELRGTGANQTTVQPDLFGEHVRFAADVPAGSDPRRAVETALSAATGAFEDTPPGPVQLNLAFRDPLVPAPGDRLPPESGRRVYRAPTARWPLISRRPPGPCRNGALWCWPGTTPDRSPRRSPAPTACRCWPSHPPMRGSGRTRWGPTGFCWKPSVRSLRSRSSVWCSLAGPLSRPVSALLARADVPSALYQPVPVAWYQPGRRTELPLDNLADLADFAGRGSAAWLDAWLLAGAAAQHAVDLVLAGSTAAGPAAAGPAATGPAVGALVWEHSRGQLVLGSSNGIRDVDLAGAPAQAGRHGLRQPRPVGDRRDHRHGHRHRTGRTAGNHGAAGRCHLPARRRRAAARRR